MNSTDVVFIAFLLHLGLLVYLTMPKILTRRYVPWVIKVFEERHATDAESARPVEKLFPLPFMQHIFRWRDYTYKRVVLEALIRSNIVKSTEDGRPFFSRENLRFYGADKR